MMIANDRVVLILTKAFHDAKGRRKIIANLILCSPPNEILDNIAGKDGEFPFGN